MNRVPILVPNLAYIEEGELDEDVTGEVVVDEAEEVIQGLERLTREIRSLMSLPLGDRSSQQHTVVPNVDVWDTGKAIEQEYRLYPDPTMKEVRDRLFNQVWDLLQIMQERVDQYTCNNMDMR